MSQFVLYLLKMSLCSGVLYAYYHLALRNRVFHQYNRFYLLAAVLFSILFPLIPLPQMYNAAQPADPIQLYNLLRFSSGESKVTVHAAPNWNWQMAVVVLYIAVCFVLLGRLVAGLLQIRRLMIGAKVQHSQKVKFVPTNHAAAPFSFFNWLFWKEEIDLESDGGKAIFRHELVHIQEKHSIDKLLLQTVLILFWINPFFWLVRRELQMIHEFIADKKSVGQQGAAALAAMILEAAYSKKPYQFTNAFFQQPIKRRLAMLQKTLSRPHNAYLGRVLSLPLCAFLLFAFAKKEEQPGNKINATTENIPAPVLLHDTIPASEIKEIRVSKKDSAKTVHILYKNGTEETLTEQQLKEKAIIKVAPGNANSKKNLDNALYVIDGQVMGTMDDNKLQEIDPDNIESMNVLKGEHATKKYGEKGKNGVIEITTKKTAPVTFKATSKNGAMKMEAKEVVVKLDDATSSNKTLLVIDGQEQGLVGDSKKLNEIDPNNIESMTVLKDEHAIKKYGAKGKNGVIEIITKEKK